jgi:hypothetical protein
MGIRRAILAAVGAVALLCVSGSQSDPYYSVHGIYGQIEASSPNDNWSQLVATCNVTARTSDPGGTIDGDHTATFKFNLDARGQGQSGSQFIALDRACHTGHPTYPVPVKVSCRMTGGHQKTPQPYDMGTESTDQNKLAASDDPHEIKDKKGRPSWPPHKEQHFTNQYFTVSLAVAELECKFVDQPPPLPPNINPVPPEDNPVPPDHKPPPTPPPQGGNRQPTWSGLHVNPPACFKSAAERAALNASIDDRIARLQAQMGTMTSATDRATAQSQIDSLNDIRKRAKDTPDCPPPTGAVRTSPTPSPKPKHHVIKEDDPRYMENYQPPVNSNPVPHNTNSGHATRPPPETPPGEDDSKPNTPYDKPVDLPGQTPPQMP